MLYSGYAESAGNPFGFEQAYRDALRVYRLFDREQNIWLHLRAGEHETTAADIENFVDFSTAFSSDARPKQETWINGYTFENWQRVSGESLDPRSYPSREFRIPESQTGIQPLREKLRKQIEWALGEDHQRAQYVTTPHSSGVSSCPRDGSRIFQPAICGFLDSRPHRGLKVWLGQKYLSATA